MSTAPTSAGTGEQQGAPPSPEAIMQLGGGFWASKTLLSAIELGLFTELASSARRTPRRCAPGSACTSAARSTSSTRSSRCEMLERDDGLLREHPVDGPVPRPHEADVHGRDARDDERAPVRVLGLADRGAAHGRAAERGEDRGRPLRRALRRSRAAARLRQGDERDQHGHRHGDRAFVPLGPPQDRHRHRLRGGDGARPDRAAHEHISGGGFDLPAARADLRRLRRRGRPVGPADLPHRRLLRRGAASGRRARHGAHPPRLGDGRRSASCSKRPTGRCPTAAR